MGVELPDDFQGLCTGEIGHGVVDDGQVDFLEVDESGDVGGGIGDEGVDTSWLKDFFDSLGPGPVGVTEQHVNALRIRNFVCHNQCFLQKYAKKTAKQIETVLCGG